MDAGSGSAFGDCDGLEFGVADIGVAVDSSGSPVVSTGGLAKLGCEPGLASDNDPGAASARVSRSVSRSERVIRAGVDVEATESQWAEPWDRAREW